MKTKQVHKLLVVMLSFVMIVSLFAGLSVTASAAETTSTSCTETGCGGTYENGFCTVCGGYEEPALVGGYYEIGNAGQLYWFADFVNQGGDNLKANGKLTDNITVNASVLTDGKLPNDTSTLKQWTPIGTSGSRSYTGTFDGQNHTISGLFYSGSDEYVGLFGRITSGATIQNVGVIDSCFQGNGKSCSLGGIVGSAEADETVGSITISNCSSAVLLVSTANMPSVGGVVGDVTTQQGRVTIQNCSNTGKITAVSKASYYGNCSCGGVVGFAYANEGTVDIRNCFNTGELTATSVSDYFEPNCGGVAGYIWSSNSGTATLKNCFSTGKQTATGVEGRVYAGGVAGYATANGDNSSVALSNCYCTAENACGGESDSDGAKVTIDKLETKTVAQFASGEVAYLLNDKTSEGKLVWKQTLSGESKQDLPAFTGGTVYYGYANCTTTTQSYINEPYTTAGHYYDNGFCTRCSEYEPCEGKGTTENPYLIKNAGNLYWFAAQVNGGERSINCKLTADIVVNKNVLNADGTLNSEKDDDGNYTNSNNFRIWASIGDGYKKTYSGTFDGNGKSISGLYFNDSSHDYAGLFSYVEHNGTVKNVAVEDSYIKGGYNVGGVVALNIGTVTNCYNTGTIIGCNCVGGVVGYNWMPLWTEPEICGEITSCYNTGTVTGSGYVGGVAGDNDGTITDCYNTGTVTGSSYVGGVLGENTNNGKITNCYNLDTSAEKTIGDKKGEITNVESKTADQFASGEVAALLGSSFGQNLGKDNAPTLGGTPVTNYGFYGQSMNIGASLSMKYYVTVFDEKLDTSKLKVEFTFLGEVKTVEEATKDEATGLYVFTLNGITPQCLGENIQAVLKYDGEVKDTKATYSVEENLTNLLKDESLAKTTKTLINDILAYGKAAEAVTGYNSLKGDYSVRTGLTIKGEKVKLELPYTAYTVRFGYVNYIKLKLKQIDTITANGQVLNWTFDGETNITSTQTDGIAPTDFGNKILFKATPGSQYYEMSLSVNDYLFALSQSDASVEYKTLAQALYNYGLSAHIYSGKHTWNDDATCTHGNTCSVCGAEDEATIKDHSYKYTVDQENHSITEKCGNGCGHEATITLKAPTDLIYNGEKKEADVTEIGKFVGSYELSYWREDQDGGSNAIDATVWNVRLGVNGAPDGTYVDLQFTITPAPITYTAPSAITGLTYNGEEQALITAGSFPEGFEYGVFEYSMGNNNYWDAAIPKETNAGDYTVYYRVILTNDNYKLADGCAETGSVDVKIAKADATFTAPTAVDGWTYDGKEHPLVKDVSYNVGTMIYTVKKDGESLGVYNELPKVTDAGEYTIGWRFVVDGEQNYNNYTNNGTLTVVVEKADSTITKQPTAKDGLTYTGSSMNFLSNTPAATGGTICYSLNENGGYVAYDEFKLINAGTYTVWYKVMGDENHKDTEPQSITVTIAKANARIDSMPSDVRDLVFNGQPKKLINAGSTKDGTMMYSLDGTAWSEEIPTAVNAGRYEIFYKIVGDDNHNDTSGKDKIVVSIGQKELNESNVTVSLNNNSYVYSGKENKPTVTVKLGDNDLVGGTDYALTYTNNINVGTATVTITFKGNYSGETSVTFTIIKNSSTDEFDGPWITA